jgi:hypothetical protein
VGSELRRNGSAHRIVSGCTCATSRVETRLQVLLERPLESIPVRTPSTPCWNSIDLDRLKELVHPDVLVIHKNRGVEGTGRDAMFSVISDMSKAFPDRSIEENGRWAVNGDSGFREAVWHGPRPSTCLDSALPGSTAGWRCCH